MADTFDIAALKASEETAGGGTETKEAVTGTEDKVNEEPKDVKTEEVKTEEVKTEASAEGSPEKAAADKLIADKAIEDKKLTEDALKTTASKEAEEAFLKKFGFKTMEEMEEKFKAPESPEVLAKKEEQYKSAVDNFAISKDYMKRDEIIALENMRKAEPTSLVFGEFSKEYLEKHKDATPDQIKQEFELFYHIGSTNEVLKEKGEAQIKKVADAALAVLEDKYKKAKESYDTASSERAKIPEYKKLVQGVIKANVPDKIALYKDGDNDPVTFNITDADRAEVEKFLASEEGFAEFLEKGSGQPTQDFLKDKAVGYLRLKNWDLAIKTAFDAGKSSGTKDGSTTGADASFKMKDTADVVVVDEKNLNDEEKGKLSSLFGGR
jgi:hypothetical protein